MSAVVLGFGNDSGSVRDEAMLNPLIDRKVYLSPAQININIANMQIKFLGLKVIKYFSYFYEKRYEEREEKCEECNESKEECEGENEKEKTKKNKRRRMQGRM